MDLHRYNLESRHSIPYSTPHPLYNPAIDLYYSSLSKKASKLLCHGCASGPSPRPMSTILHCFWPSSDDVGSASLISNTSRTAWITLLESSFVINMPLRRWISKSAGWDWGSDWDSTGGREESQRTERSQASTSGIFSDGMGGVVIAIVEIAW